MNDILPKPFTKQGLLDMLEVRFLSSLKSDKYLIDCRAETPHAPESHPTNVQIPTGHRRQLARRLTRLPDGHDGRAGFGRTARVAERAHDGAHDGRGRRRADQPARGARAHGRAIRNDTPEHGQRRSVPGPVEDGRRQRRRGSGERTQRG